MFDRERALKRAETPMKRKEKASMPEPFLDEKRPCSTITLDLPPHKLTQGTCAAG